MIRIERDAEIVEASSNADSLTALAMSDMLGQCAVVVCYVSHASRFRQIVLHACREGHP